MADVTFVILISEFNCVELLKHIIILQNTRYRAVCINNYISNQTSGLSRI